jgi:hypothetical protein
MATKLRNLKGTSDFMPNEAELIIMAIEVYRGLGLDAYI